MELMLRSANRLYKAVIFILLFINFFWLYIIADEERAEKKVARLQIFYNEHGNGKHYPAARSYERRDWHDWAFIEYEKTRVGPGEQGKSFYLTDASAVSVNEMLFKTEGLYVVASDKISVNRSVPDTRLPICKTMKYLKNLPKTSVIIICHNEWLSILLRTIHSVYNRTPRELLHEIIIVNDASTKSELYGALELHVRKSFDARVSIVNLKQRSGLIVARMEGARKATGEVLAFLDSHMEVNTNWLPPLLEPIAVEPKTSTVPIIDYFYYNTFKYANGGDGSRGVFDWNFVYHPIPRRPEDLIYPERPAPTPIMLGGVFAIRKDYFFDLGGYDEKLLIWNGENYELSFKLWLCGGQILEVPCSRVGHVFRKHYAYRAQEKYDFVAHNFKRIAEVWLDEYKDVLYSRNPKRYNDIDPGDLTKEKLIREKLNCKSFSYFLEYVMPDQVEMYPWQNFGVFASGTIQSEGKKGYCIDAPHKRNSQWLELHKCHQNLTHPYFTQNFFYSWHRHIFKPSNYDKCIDAEWRSMERCHFRFEKQFWFYNLTTHQLVNPTSNQCLTTVLKQKNLAMANCSTTDITQKWKFGYTNESALLNWESFGKPLPQKPTVLKV